MLCPLPFGVASISILDTPSGYDFDNAVSMSSFPIGVTVVGVFVRNRHRIFADSEQRATEAEADRIVATQRAVAHTLPQLQIDALVEYGGVTYSVVEYRLVDRTRPRRCTTCCARRARPLGCRRRRTGRSCTYGAPSRRCRYLPRPTCVMRSVRVRRSSATAPLTPRRVRSRGVA